MRESLLYDKLPGGKVKCNVCAVRCLIPDGDRGACRTRLNEHGTLYTLLYGLTSSVCIDPIEKKPLYHFYPGSRILSMGTRGCNFRCPGCQNWEISHDSPDRFGENMERLDPAESARLAKRRACHGIGWTYNDPTIWLEHTLEAMIEAKKLGLYSAFMTNGYATEEQMAMIGPYLTAWRVDLKGFSRESYKKVTGLARWDAVLEMTKLAQHEYKMHVECVTNVTPTINDGEEIARGIAGWIRDGRNPELFEDGRQIRDWVHVRDVVAAALALLGHDGSAQLVNVCSGTPTTLLDACEHLAALIGGGARPVVRGGYRPGDMRHCLGDPSSLERLIGRAPITFREGAASAFAS